MSISKMAIPYRILIVEDELIIAEVLKDMLTSLGYTVVAIAKNYDRAISQLKKHSEIDLALLDINLGGENTGIDVGEVINADYKFPIAYITSYTDHETIAAVGKTKPEAYVIKPFKKEDILATVEIIRARNKQKDKVIILKEGYDTIRIKCLDILYLKADGNYVQIHTLSDKFLSRTRIEDFILKYGEDNFAQVHRSYAVNIQNIDAVVGQHVHLGAHKIPLSRKYKNVFMNKFSSM
ncbi:MAG: LytR/AlgR family response regulator transcription factor [Bacteroidia bacterium]